MTQFLDLLHCIQILFEQIFNQEDMANFDNQHNDDETWIIAGVGKGKCKNGPRKKWKKNPYFERDLLRTKLDELKENGFLQTYAGYSTAEIARFFDMIKNNVIRPKETFFHARNKLLMWIDRIHNKLGWNACARQYKIGRSTAKGFVKDVEKGILKSFRGSDIISWPTNQEKQQMVDILKKRNAPMPQAPFSLDGKHPKCIGKQHKERASWKYRFQPCFNCLFIVERVFGRIVAFNLDQSARKHDITVLRESQFFDNLDEITNGWYILADKGYIGVEIKSVIPAINKKNAKKRKQYPKTFWKQFNNARNDSERAFSHFFYNKFGLLSDWQGKSRSTFVEWCSSVVCCIILYNYLKLPL